VQFAEGLHFSGLHFFVGYQLRSDLMKFSRILTVLQNQPIFQLRDFENKMEYIRNVVAQHLWRLLVEESNLVDHLHVGICIIV
jgi:gamma-tubulin complex component 4